MLCCRLHGVSLSGLRLEAWTELMLAASTFQALPLLPPVLGPLYMRVFSTMPKSLHEQGSACRVAQRLEFLAICGWQLVYGCPVGSQQFAFPGIVCVCAPPAVGRVHASLEVAGDMAGQHARLWRGAPHQVHEGPEGHDGGLALPFAAGPWLQHEAVLAVLVHPKVGAGLARGGPTIVHGAIDLQGSRVQGSNLNECQLGRDRLSLRPSTTPTWCTNMHTFGRLWEAKQAHPSEGTLGGRLSKSWASRSSRISLLQETPSTWVGHGRSSLRKVGGTTPRWQ